MSTVKKVQIIFTPAVQEQAGCKGPEFENPKDVQIDDTGGVFVETSLSPADKESGQFSDTDTAVYYYPGHVVARTKIIREGL